MDDDAIRAARRANRSPISMWDFALWAYRSEKVRFLCGDHRDFASGLSGGETSQALFSRYTLSSDDPMFVTMHFAPACHEDALALHGMVSRLTDPQDFWLIVRTAELEIPPLQENFSMQKGPPNCSRWSDGCVTCTRDADGDAPACSNIGFACQPKSIRCIASATGR